MTGKAGLKAGLIGGAILLVVTLLSQIPGICCFCYPLTFLIYLGVGALATFFLQPPREAGSGAGAGTIAGLISGALGGLVWIIAITIQIALTDQGDIMATIDPAAMQQLIEMGIDPEVFALFSGIGGAALAGGGCCMTGIAAGAGLGAAGGAIMAAIASD